SAAEIQGAQFRKRESAARQRSDRLRFEPPELRPIHCVVVDRKSRRLQRRQIPADRTRGHLKFLGELRNRVGSSRGELPQQGPLPNQLAIPAHLLLASILFLSLALNRAS